MGIIERLSNGGSRIDVASIPEAAQAVSLVATLRELLAGYEFSSENHAEDAGQLATVAELVGLRVVRECDTGDCAANCRAPVRIEAS